MAEYKQYITQIQENGSVMISEDVVATIVAHALSEVEGVGSLGIKPGVSIADFTNKKNWGKGLKILIAEDNTLTSECAGGSDRQRGVHHRHEGRERLRQRLRHRPQVRSGGMKRGDARELAVHLIYGRAFTGEEPEQVVSTRLDKEYYGKLAEENEVYAQRPDRFQLRYID